MSEGKKALKIVLKSIDEKALAEALIVELLEPVVMDFVKDTTNPFDDKLAEFLLPVVKEKIPVLLEKLAKEAEEAV